MPNHFAAIGYAVETDEAFAELVDKAAREGDPIAAPSGYYLHYKTDDRIELWAQATPIGDLLDCVPHYRGESRLKLGVADLIRRKERPLDGSVYGWINPHGARADGGDYPVVIKIPDYEIFRSRVETQSVITMQVTAFANELAVFESEDVFAEAQQERSRMAPESFLPTGLFADSGHAANTPEAHAVFSGHVTTFERRSNGETNRDFYAMTVSTFGGTYDVVAAPSIVPTAPSVGSIVRGSFWLTGRLVV